MVLKAASHRTPDNFRARFFCVETWNNNSHRIVRGGKKTCGQGRPRIVYHQMCDPIAEDSNDGITSAASRDDDAFEQNQLQMVMLPTAGSANGTSN